MVWAEENSRDAIFAGMKRRETYATSGTRPVVRFFGGPELGDELCAAPDMVTQAYQQGVPMGGEVDASAAEGPMKLLVSVQKDPGTRLGPGNDLQRVQIIKGWVDANGETHEQVYDVAGDADNGATVDPNTCAPVGQGFSQLCTVWQDPGFNPDASAAYYARVVENPSCRWTTWSCLALEEHERPALCADPAEAKTTRERAWSSPIWYTAQGTGD